MTRARVLGLTVLVSWMAMLLALVVLTLMALQPRSATNPDPAPPKPGCVFPIGDPTLACESSTMWCVLCLEEAAAVRCYKFRAGDCELQP